MIYSFGEMFAHSPSLFSRPRAKNNEKAGKNRLILSCFFNLVFLEIDQNFLNFTVKKSTKVINCNGTDGLVVL